MNTIIFTKFSNDRNRRFSIRTDILEDEKGNRTVHKIPAFKEAENHVASISRWYQILSAQTKGTRLSYNRCTPITDGVELEYLTGESLETLLLTLMHQKGEDACAQEFVNCLEFIRDLHTGSVFEPTDAFREVFGEDFPAPGSVCAPCTDIDLLCENIIVSGDEWTAIDYEWTFDFPVPVNFLLFRMIKSFTENANRGEEFRRYDFMGKMGITEEEQEIYAAMEAHFQQYILMEHVPIRNLYDDISEGFVLADDFSGNESLQIYTDTGDGFSEESSVYYPMNFVGHWIAKRKYFLPEGAVSLRIDPGFRSCMVHLKTLRFDNQAGRAPFFLREGSILGDWIFFSEDDPNLFIGTIPEGARSLMIEYDLYDADLKAMDEIRQQTESNKLMTEHVEAQTEQIKQLASQDDRMKKEIDQIHTQIDQITEELSTLNQNIFIRIGRKLHGLTKAGNRRKED